VLPTVDFSAEVTADGCETETGDTVCDVDVGATFTVTVNINSFGGLPVGGGYNALQARLDDSATGLTVQAAPNAAWIWPSCVYPAGGLETVGANTIETACMSFFFSPFPSSWYKGPYVDILYQCSTIEGTHTITLVNGTGFLETNLSDENLNIVAEVGNESLTINCNEPGVGGIVDVVSDGDAPAEMSGSSSNNYTLPIAAAIAGAIMALAVGGWYARRRLLR
jgi:hypothetical protein